MHKIHPQSPPQRGQNVRKDLRTVFIEGISFSVMVGIGESYLPAFVLAFGMGEVASGLIATLPLVAGGILQLAAPLGIRLVGSHRRWAVLCAATQAIAFVPLITGAALGAIPGIFVFASAVVYWASGMAISPAWNVWVERLIPAAVRTHYFARRTSATNLGVLVGLLIGGLILDRTSADTRPLLGFALLFALACTARLTSASLLSTQRQPDLPPMPYEPREALGLMRRFPRTSGGALLIYMLTLTTTVTIASPFFTAYMLRQLGLSYSAYMSLFIIALAAKVIALPLLGRLAKRYGLRRLLRAAWLGITLVPVLWLLSDSYTYLIGLQILAGTSWAAHEYVTFLLLFEMIDAKDRGTLLTAYNLGHALASAGGSLLGGFVFDMLGGGMTGYYILFGVSSVARASCLIFLVRVPGVHVPALSVVFRSIAVRPSVGAVIRPILATLRLPHEEGKKTKPLPPNHADKT